MRLIDADALIQDAEPYLTWDMLAAINNSPTIDAVPVVRCKDCDVPHNKWTGCPKMNGLIPPPEHFCSYGEQKEGDDNG